MGKLSAIFLFMFSAVVAHAANILLVVTNAGELQNTDKPTGYWLSEVTHAWVEFVDAGHSVHFASPEGGFAPMDPRSFDLDDPANKRFWHNLDAVQSLMNTRALSEVDPGDYAAIYFAGGHGTMFDFPDSEALIAVTEEIYRDGGIVAAVCHGPAALVNIEHDGEPLVQGKRVAAFTNAEEEAVGLSGNVPFLLQSKLERQGARFVPAPNFQANVVVDGRLITGQNPASATGAAKALVKKLED